MFDSLPVIAHMTSLSILSYEGLSSVKDGCMIVILTEDDFRRCSQS